LVVYFGGDVHTGAQQGAGACDPLGQGGHSLRGARNRGHGRCQSPLHEFAHGLCARDGTFPQLGNALLNDGMVSPGG
jgi:hypothetical protein